MFISNYNNDRFSVKFKDIDIDIFDYDEVLNICKHVMRKIRSNDEDYGLYELDIYTNYQYGMIIDGEKIASDEMELDVKIRFHIESIFLEEVDFFNCIGKKIYYYKDKFYVEYDKDSLVDSYILYGDIVCDILDNGIVINN